MHLYSYIGAYISEKIPKLQISFFFFNYLLTYNAIPPTHSRYIYLYENKLNKYIIYSYTFRYFNFLYF